jgi:hypothetical protein
LAPTPEAAVIIGVALCPTALGALTRTLHTNGQFAVRSIMLILTVLVVLSMVLRVRHPRMMPWA